MSNNTIHGGANMRYNGWNILVFLVCLLSIFGYMIYSTYRDYHKYKSQEGLNISKAINKTANKVKNQAKKITKIGSSLKGVLNILKCPVSIFSNIGKCSGYYYRDKLFELIWIIIWIINFIIIFIPAFILDKLIMCFIFKRCLNVTPNDVCISRKTFFKAFENIYYLLTGGGRYLHRDSSDMKKCYCSPPLVFMFNPLRNFTSYFERLVKSSPNFVALLIPIIILIILGFRQKSK